MPEQHVVYLGLGSNLGNRAANLHAALKALAAFATVEATSFLYETPPAYVADQPDFLNAACRITTHLSPEALLAEIKNVERAQGRQQTIRYGPRIIDIDILFYDAIQLESAELSIPHPRLVERDFVLGPLCDLAPDLRHPLLGDTIRELGSRLSASALPRVMPVGDRLWTWGEKTYIMGILNITPDSFSGDGLWRSDEAVVERAVAQAQRFVAEGADCLDVGGQSTRPGHRVIGVEEESARVAPVVQAIAQAVQAPISVDTFRSEVAEAALAAGAQMLNDVWGLRFDPRLARVALHASVPLVFMHNRTQPADPAYQHLPGPHKGPVYGDIIAEIRAELEASLQQAQVSGLPRWLLIADPGIGFGKTLEQHLELIRRLGEFKPWGYPMLFGASRKGFIGKLLDNLPPEERDEGTLATCILAIARGADILRVHNVRAMSRAARVADAIVRS